MANLNELMTSIAEAIRHKRNITDKINAQNFPNEIEKITGGGSGENSVIKRLMSTGVYGLFNDHSDNNLLRRLNDDDLKSLLHYDDTSELKNLSGMFGYNYKITTIPLLNTSNVTNMSHMFDSYTNLQNIPQFDTSKVTNMREMFYNCTSLTSIPQFNTSKVTDMSKMFYQCTALTSIPKFNTSNVTNMAYMFYGCEALTTIPALDTSKVTDMGAMFYNCSGLTSIPLLDTNKVTDMATMFYNCSNLTSIQLDTSNVLSISHMFYHCYKLTTIDITHMKIKESTYTKNFAAGCCSLTKLIIRNMDKIPPLYSSSPFADCYHFKGVVNETYNPEGLKDGRIYVPDDKVEALKTAFMWKNYADIIVPLSLLDATEINDINVYEDEEGNIININNLSYEEVQ